MTTATIRPLAGGKAEFSWRGVEHVFDDVWSAIAEAESRGIEPYVLRFPNPSVEVLAVAPALRVLT